MSTFPLGEDPSRLAVDALADGCTVSPAVEGTAAVVGDILDGSNAAVGNIVDTLIWLSNMTRSDITAHVGLFQGTSLMTPDVMEAFLEYLPTRCVSLSPDRRCVG